MTNDQTKVMEIYQIRNKKENKHSKMTHTLSIWLTKYFEIAMVTLVAIMSPLIGVLAAVFILTIFDLISGIYAAYKRGEKISSRAMSMTVSKVIFYNIAIFTGVGFQYLLNDTLPIVKIIASFIGLIESKSIYENIGYILGIDFWTALKGYISRTPSILNKLKEKNPPTV